MSVHRADISFRRETVGARGALKPKTSRTLAHGRTSRLESLRCAVRWHCSPRAARRCAYAAPRAVCTSRAFSPPRPGWLSFFAAGPCTSFSPVPSRRPSALAILCLLSHAPGQRTLRAEHTLRLACLLDESDASRRAAHQDNAAGSRLLLSIVYLVAPQFCEAGSRGKGGKRYQDRG